MHRIAILALVALSVGPLAAQDDQNAAHYFGQRQSRMVSGAKLPATDSLLRRVFRPADGTVTDYVIELDPSGKRPPLQYTVTYHMDGRKFTAEESRKAFQGKGSVEGEPFAWTAWTADLTLRDGRKVDLTGRVNPDGLSIHRDVKTQGGQPFVVMDEDLKSISFAEWDRRQKEALGAVFDKEKSWTRSEFFQGTSTVMLAGSRSGSRVDVFLRRDFDPKRGTITQTVASIDPTGRFPVSQNSVVMKVAADGTFHLEERNRAFRGDGVLAGPAWEWTGLTSRTRFSDGSTARTTERWSVEGIEGETRFFDASQRPLYNSITRFRRLDAQDFEKRFRAAFPDGTAPLSADTKAPRIRYFRGTSRAVPADGGKPLEAPMLLQLTYDPVLGTITHHTVKLDPRGKGRPTALGLVFRVTKDTFRIEARAKAATGQGRLRGPDWNWTRIDRTTVFPDGTRLISTETLLPDGVFEGTHQLFRPDKTKVMDIEDRLKEVSGAVWRSVLEAAVGKR
ncbi:MAG TPA: hypothetical protein ENK43_01755 [Planctomycetes bacterium]|nr:hypothetical protein [Planctomycetota bacterium]